MPAREASGVPFAAPALIGLSNDHPELLTFDDAHAAASMCAAAYGSLGVAERAQSLPATPAVPNAGDIERNVIAVKPDGYDIRGSGDGAAPINLDTARSAPSRIG